MAIPQDISDLEAQKQAIRIEILQLEEIRDAVHADIARSKREHADFLQSLTKRSDELQKKQDALIAFRTLLKGYAFDHQFPIPPNHPLFT